jgi:hypothetical protein
MTKLIPILSLLLSAACTDPDVFQPGNLTTDEQQQVQLAIDEWCEYGHCASFGDGESSFAMADVIPGWSADTVGLWHGRDGHSEITIKIGVDVRLTALHELGHHFGCGRGDRHLPVGNVMAESQASDVLHLTQADVDCAE